MEIILFVSSLVLVLGKVQARVDGRNDVGEKKKGGGEKSAKRRNRCDESEREDGRERGSQVDAKWR